MRFLLLPLAPLGFALGVVCALLLGAILLVASLLTRSNVFRAILHPDFRR